MSASKSDRSSSPAAVSEDSRRDLLARQHRALYGNESPAFFPPGPLSDENSRAESQAAGTPSSAGVRGASPRGVDLFGLTQSGVAPESASGLQSPPRANSTSSPSSAINAGFPDQTATSTSSPGGADSPTSHQTLSKPSAGPIGSVGPIGSRPVAGQTSTVPVSNPAVNNAKRSTTPLPSPLGFGFTSGEAATVGERTTSSASNPAVTAPTGSKESSAGGVGLGWGNGSGVWGSKGGLGVQASVWG